MDQFVVSVDTNTGVRSELTVAAEGAEGWLGSPHKLTGLPPHLAGGTLVRLPYRAIPINTSIVVTVAGSDARLYLATEASTPGTPANIDGDLARRTASTAGWLAESCSISHEDECPKLTMFSSLAQRGLPIALPSVMKQDSIVLLIAVPVSCDSFAVAITSNSSASYDRMVVVEEGVTAWIDRDHKYMDVPSCLLNGILFQGPYKDIPDGTIVTVRPNARARVFVVLERSCSGQLHQSLAERGWQVENVAPRWHGMPTMLMFSLTCSAGAAVSLPATQGNAAVFSVVVCPAAATTVAPAEVSCVNTRAQDPSRSFVKLEPAPLSQGTVVSQSGAERFQNVPGWMLGATLFRAPTAGPSSGTVFSVRASAPSVVYIIFEEERSGGLLPNALPDGKWERRQESPTWNSSSKLAVFARRVAARETLTTPEIVDASSQGSAIALVVKVDIESFDATVQTSSGLEYGRSQMMETACAWSDCANVWTWVPTYMNGGTLFNGPHDSTPQGSVIRISATGAFRAFVIVEKEYRGGQARHGGFVTALPADGWQPESAAPSWGDGNSVMKIFSKMAPEGQDLCLPTTFGPVVFSIVVVNIAASTDTLAEELRKIFKAWDPSGKGGIHTQDLDIILTALCPSLDAKGKEAMFKSIDRRQRGVISYEELIEKVLLASDAAQPAN